MPLSWRERWNSAGRLKELEIVRQFPEPSTIKYTRQQQALGLGHAIWCARDFVNDDPFAVILPDGHGVGRTWLSQSDDGCLQ